MPDKYQRAIDRLVSRIARHQAINPEKDMRLFRALAVVSAHESEQKTNSPNRRYQRFAKMFDKEFGV